MFTIRIVGAILMQARAENPLILVKRLWVIGGVSLPEPLTCSCGHSVILIIGDQNIDG